MFALILALAVAAQPDLSAPPPSDVRTLSLARPLEPPRQGLLHGREMFAAAGGVLVGDALVLGLGYGTLQLFARGTIAPTAGNFRNAALGWAATAVIVPPLAASLFASWTRSGPRRGAAWKAFLLTAVGHAAALVAGYAMGPAYWAIVPMQIAAMGPAASLGLNWGPARNALPER